MLKTQQERLGNSRWFGTKPNQIIPIPECYMFHSNVPADRYLTVKNLDGYKGCKCTKDCSCKTDNQHSPSDCIVGNLAENVIYRYVKDVIIHNIKGKCFRKQVFYGLENNSDIH